VKITMTINKKLQNGVALSAAALALMASPAKGSIIIESPTGIGSNATITAHDYDFRNGDEGINYESLLGKHQLDDMLWAIPEVQTQYGGNFGSFATDSAAHGYSIESGSQVGNGWSSSLNADGTYSIGNLSSTNPSAIPGGDFDIFSDNKIMNGNYFFNNSLTDVNNDGNNDYQLKFWNDLNPHS